MWADNLNPEGLKLLGDINEDNIVSVKDLEELQKHFAGVAALDATRLASANLNADYYRGEPLVDARDFLYLRARNDCSKHSEG